MAPSVITRPGVFAISSLTNTSYIIACIYEEKRMHFDLNASFGAFLDIFYKKKGITRLKSSLFWVNKNLRR